MKELIDKISSYNIFNFLFPGIVFVVLLNEMTKYSFIIENNFIGIFVYYFIGLVISRIGSLILEPILQKKSFIKYAKYNDYVQASDKDKKIELFSEINNMYRTLISVFILLLLGKLYEIVDDWLNIPTRISFFILSIILLLVFVLSYRKQTKYIVKRVNSRINKNQV